jgi:hypothetical protein
VVCHKKSTTAIARNIATTAARYAIVYLPQLAHPCGPRSRPHDGQRRGSDRGRSSPVPIPTRLMTTPTAIVNAPTTRTWRPEPVMGHTVQCGPQPNIIPTG